MESFIKYNFGPKIIINEDQIFYQTDQTVAFVNLRPVIKGHVLICPKRLAPKLDDLNESEVFDLFKSAQLVGRMLTSHYNTENIHYAI